MASPEPPAPSRPTAPNRTYKYKAFISYKHAINPAFVRHFERALKSYAKPLLARPICVFRDENHMAPGIDLPRLINEALDDAEFLVLLASPAAAESPWVADELARWLGVLGRIEQLLVVLVAGEIVSDPVSKRIVWEETTALPPMLRDHIGTVPYYVDLRSVAATSDLSLTNAAFVKAVNGISARFRGIDPNEMLGEEVLQHRRNLRLRNAAAATLATLLLGAAVAGIVAVRQRNVALASLTQARASELASRARARSTDRPDLATALAIASIQASEETAGDPGEGIAALRAAVQSTRGVRLFCPVVDHETYRSTATAVDISPDGTLVALGTPGMLCVFEKQSNGGYRLIEGLQSLTGLSHLQFTPDGRWLISLADGYLRALDVSRTIFNPRVPKFLTNNYQFDRLEGIDMVDAIAFSASRTRMAVTRQGRRTIDIWDTQAFDPKGSPILTLDVPGDMVAFGLSPDGAVGAALVYHDSAPPDPVDRNSLAFKRTLDFGFDPETLRFAVYLWRLDGGAVAPVRLDGVLRGINGRAKVGNLLKFIATIRLTNEATWIAASVQLEDAHRSEQFAATVYRRQGTALQTVLEYRGELESQGEWRRVSDVGFSPNGRWIYAARDHQLRLWRADALASTTAPLELNAPPIEQESTKLMGSIASITFSGDGRSLAVSTSNGALVVWDLAVIDRTNTVPAIFVNPTEPLAGAPTGIRFDPASETVAMTGQNGFAQLCTVRDSCGPLEPLRFTAPLDEGQLVDLVGDPERRWVAAISEAKGIQIWAANFSRRVFATRLPARSSVRLTPSAFNYIREEAYTAAKLVPSMDGRWAAAYESEPFRDNRGISLLRLDGAPAERRIAQEELACATFAALAFRPDGRGLLSWLANSSNPPCASAVRLPLTDSEWRGRLAARPLVGYGGGELEISPGGGFIFEASSYRSPAAVWRWPVDTAPTRLQLSTAVSLPLVQVAFSPHDTAFVALSSDSPDLTRQPDRSNVDRDAGVRFAVTFLRVTGDAVGTRGTSLGTYYGRPSVGFSPDGRWLIVASYPGIGRLSTITLWSTAALSSPVRQWELPAEGNPLTLAFDRAARRVLIAPDRASAWAPAGSDDDRLDGEPRPALQMRALLIDLQDQQHGSQVLDFGPIEYVPSDEPSAYEFSTDGRWLVSSFPATVWSVPPSGAPARVFAEGSARLALAPDGRSLVSTRTDTTQLWRIDGMRVQRVGQLGPAGRAAITGDSARVAWLAGGEITVRLTSLSALRDRASAAIGRNLRAEDWNAEFPGQPYQITFPDHPVHETQIAALVRAADAAMRSGQRVTAAASLARAVTFAIQSHSIDTCNAVIRAGIQMRLADVVLRAADYAVGVLPQDYTIVDNRGKARAAAGDSAGALRDFATVIAASPGSRTARIREQWMARLSVGETIRIADLLKDDVELAAEMQI